MHPWQNKCCCCISLKAGGLIMGTVSLIISLMILIATTLICLDRVYISRVLAHYKLEHSEEAHLNKKVSIFKTVQEVIDEFSEEEELPPEEDDQVNSLANSVFIFSVIGILVVGVYLICSCLLIFGAARGRRWFVVPWIAATFILLLAYFVIVCVAIWFFGGRVEVLAFLGCSVIQNAIGFYLWICVVSLFQALTLASLRNKKSKEIELKTIFSNKYTPVPTNDFKH